MSEERRCLVIDDQPLVRLGVRRLLGESFDVDEAEDGETALRLITGVGDFDVAVVDTGRPPGTSLGSGARTIRLLLEAHPGLGVVAHGERPERQLAAEAIRAGARAYVAKSSPAAELTRAIEAAAGTETFVDPAVGPRRGRSVAPTVTRRQREILQLYADGHSTGRAAKVLGLSLETVRTHTKAALARLEATDRVHAVAVALRAGLIE